MLSLAPELSQQEVTEILEETARQSVLATPDEDGHDDEYGFGLIQPAAALARTVKPPPDVQGGAGCDCGDDKGGAAFVVGVSVLLRRRKRAGLSRDVLR